MHLLLLLILALIFNPLGHSTTAEPFRFHIFAEPTNFDPQRTSSASGNYLFHAIYRGLYRYHGKKGLLKEGAQDCRRTRRHLRCTLKKTHRWSDGRRITANDYVASFRRLIDPKNASPQSDVLFTIKNARLIWAGKRKTQDLGVTAVDDDTLDFQFEVEDAEFEFKLIHPALSPLPTGGYPDRDSATQLITSGPFVIKEWKSGSRVRFARNKYYIDLENVNRPEAEAVFIDSDATATTLYEAGKLSFLRRVPSADIPRMRQKPGFHQIGMARFDYIGFGPQLKNLPKIRQALVEGVDFSLFLKLFDTRSQPGCPSLPLSYMDRKVCREFNPTRARKVLPKSIQPGKIEMHFSRMGGDDIARAAEYFQGQWSKNLGLKIELLAQEQAVFMRSLRSNPPMIFRKGVSLDRPTCLAALEIFAKDHPENFIHFDDPTFSLLLKRLSQTKGLSERKRLCRQAVERLLQSNALIPLGEMHFTIMASPAFTGWDLNELNQLDLSELREVPKE